VVVTGDEISIASECAGLLCHGTVIAVNRIWIILVVASELQRTLTVCRSDANVRTRNSEESTIPKKGSEGHRLPRIQFGALPYRFDGEARIEVLLVTSRETGRWIIPKGWPIKGFKPAKTAAREAYEEAGVRGHVSGRPLGRYVYEKRMEDRVASFPCEVQVFPLLVKTQLKKWPESRQRKVRWFPVPEATAVIDDDDLRKLIMQLKEHRRAVQRKYKGARQK
jgi:8-oxo-dGTP pyrophosphatase MutT (NUDIX family)